MKMLEAYLVLPALYLFYLVASSVSWRRRFVHLGAATVVLLVVSLSWAVAVDLTPADQRPYVGSSSNNSALDLAFGYNGLERLLGREGAPGGGQGQSAPENNPQEGPPQGGGFGPGGARENGEPGPLRLLDAELAGQIGWLLPLAVVGLWAASWQSKRPRLPIDQQLPQGLAPLWRRWRSRLVFSFKNLPQLSLDRRQGALVLWGMWLVTMAVFFSIAGMFHRYYMVMLAPAVAALVGIGVVALWSDYRRAGWRGWLLPLTLLGMATLHTYIILAHYDEDWTPWLPPAIAGLCLFTVGVLVAGRLLRSRPNNARGSSPAYQAGAVAVGILALLIAPTAWAFHTVWQGGGGGLAGAGPQPVQEYEYGGPGGPPPGGGPPRGGPGGPGSSNADSMLMNYLQANRDDAKYLVGTINSMSASPIILSTDEPDPVITLGGFMGRDPVLSTEELANLVDRGAVRFFLMPDRERMEQMRAEYASSQQGAPPWGGRGFLQNESVSWVEDNCKKIPQEEWQSPEDDEGQGRGGPMGRAQALYDCGM